MRFIGMTKNVTHAQNRTWVNMTISNSVAMTREENREGASNVMSDEWLSTTVYTLAYCELLTIKPDMDLTCC